MSYYQLISLLHFFLLTVSVTKSMRNFKLESQIGSTIILPACSSEDSNSNNKDASTILFKSDSGELLTINGKLIPENPRFLMKNNYSSELIIKSVQTSDQGQYECRTDQIINSIVRLNIVHLSTVHLTIPENSNLTLQCMENGMWTIEESHRGGPVQTQYSNELLISDIKRDDPRFRKIICSSLSGHEKREYVLDVTYKPTVKLLLSTRRRLICIICAHPLPHRIQWWWNTRKERDDNIHQKSINQSCIAQQITFVLDNDDESSMEQMITCEAENPYGIDRDSLLFKTSSSMSNRRVAADQTKHNRTTIKFGEMRNQTGSIHSEIDLLFVFLVVLTKSMI